MRKRALFIFTNNQYQVVFDMMWHVAFYLESALGYEVRCCGIGEDYQKARLEDWDFIFSAQGVEFAFLPEVDGKTHITWLCDHPRCVLERFADYADKEHLFVGCVDRTHITYLQHYYGIPHTRFLPHFGWKVQDWIPYQERSIDVFFPATYICWEEEVKPRYTGLEGPLKIITDKTIAYMIEQDKITTEGGFEAVLKSFKETDTDDLVRECMEFVGEYVDLYWRSYYRKKIVMALLDAGITVTVCGRNWNRLEHELTKEQHLIVLSEEMSYKETVEKMADSKMVLNIMPGFKEGAHERIAMAALNGAVCLTDSSLYIEELFGAAEGAVIYDRKSPKVLADKIKYLLKNPEEAMQIAKRGQAVAEANLTVKNFVDSMLEMLHDARR